MHLGEEPARLQTPRHQFRTCTACHKVKMQDAFHLKGVDKAGFPRSQSACKECANMRRVERYQKQQKKKKKLADIPKKFDVSTCDIEIIYQEGADPSWKETETLREYIEAIYAIPISNALIKNKN